MSKFTSFLDRKDIKFTPQRYLQGALGFMAIGLFSSLIIGLIIKTIGQQTELLWGENGFSAACLLIGGAAMAMMGPAVGAAVAYGLKPPPLVLFASIATGYMGAELGGPAGALVAAIIGAEFGKAVSMETKVDIIVTPAVTLVTGILAAKFIGPVVSALMTGLGTLIMNATDLRPFAMGIVVAVIMGLALTAPISSAALAIMLELSGLAAGAATVGCCAQMVGFAVISFRDNGVGGLFAQGIGTSMLQIANIVKNWWILVPPTVAGAVIGPFSTCLFEMTNVPAGAGMGTSGLVGQIGTFTSMGFTWNVLWSVLLLHIALPAVVSLVVDRILRKAGKIKPGDYKLEV